MNLNEINKVKTKSVSKEANEEKIILYGYRLFLSHQTHRQLAKTVHYKTNYTLQEC